MLHLLPVLVFSAAIAARALAPRIQELVLVAVLFIAHLGLPFAGKSSRDSYRPLRGSCNSLVWRPNEFSSVPMRPVKRAHQRVRVASTRADAHHRPRVEGAQSSTWMGEKLQMLANISCDVMSVLEQNQVDVVVIHEVRHGSLAVYQAHLDEQPSLVWTRVQRFGEVSFIGALLALRAITQGRNPD
jgi:hypothetical protein